jgi:hypothetical protein
LSGYSPEASAELDDGFWHTDRVTANREILERVRPRDLSMMLAAFLVDDSAQRRSASLAPDVWRVEEQTVLRRISRADGSLRGESFGTSVR